MTYLEYHPTNHLSLFVEKIWYCYAENMTSACLTIPLPNHEFVLNFSQSYKIRPALTECYALDNSIAWISGLQSRAYYSYSSGRHEMLGVLFKADGLKAFTQYNSSDFYETFIDAALVFGKSIHTLVQQVQHALLPQEKFTLIEDFLLARCAVITSPAYLAYSLNKISLSLQPKGINNICDQVSISNKSLIDAFKKHVGLSPVKYSHLLAVNRAIVYLSKGPGQSLTSLAHSLRFYDQAHFINIFKSITSLTPSQYKLQVANKKVDTNSPNFIF